MADLEHMLTVDEVAQRLRVSRNTAYRLCRDGEIKAQKIGRQWRVAESEVQAGATAPKADGVRVLVKASGGDDILDEHREKPENVEIVRPTTTGKDIIDDD